MDLKSEIAKLIQLQESDTQIFFLNQKKNIDIPAQRQALKSEFEQKKEQLVSFEETLKTFQLKRKEKELDLAAKEENVRKANSALYQLKTNKEYQAKMLEIESLKADVSMLEEEILKVFDEVEGAENDLSRAKEAVTVQEKKYNEKERAITEELKNIETRIQQLEEKRSQLAKSVDASVLSRYERLIQTRAGIAIAPVRNENCGACHMTVTAQKINEIKMYQKLISCENCVRLLYVEEDLRQGS